MDGLHLSSRSWSQGEGSTLTGATCEQASLIPWPEPCWQQLPAPGVVLTQPVCVSAEVSVGSRALQGSSWHRAGCWLCQV